MTLQRERRGAHPYYMYDAIQGQPGAIARILNEEVEQVRALARSIGEAQRVHIVGIGTSWHASLVGEHLLRAVAGVEGARAWNSFEFCAYPPTLGPQDVVVVMSHRGTKRYSAQALQMAKGAGARTAVVTGVGSEARTELADHVIRTSVPDPSSAFTISHTAAMTALAMLAVEVGEARSAPAAPPVREALGRLPALVEEALAQETGIEEWAHQARDSQRFYFAGWGPNTPTAYEVALKIKESSYLVTEGFQLEQYLHGPYVATHDGVMMTLVAPPGAGQERAATIISAVNTVGGRTVGIVEQGDAQIAPLVRTAIFMPPTPEPLTPIVYLAPLQLFTYWLALEHSRNPDTFRLDDPLHQKAREGYQL